MWCALVVPRRVDMSNKRKASNLKAWPGHEHHYMLTTFEFDTYVLSERTNSLAGNQNYYLHWQIEVCPKSKRDHLHAYFYTRNKKSWAAAKQWLYTYFGCKTGEVKQPDDRLHAQRLWTYTQKDHSRHPDQDAPVADGEAAIVPDYIKSGEPEARAGSVDLKDFKRQVIVLYGPPYTGKSTKARELCEAHSPGEVPHEIPPKTQGQAGAWVSGYEGQKCAIIEEFDPQSFSISEAKVLFDRGPRAVTAKSGGVSVLWSPTLIILTTNAPMATVKAWASQDYLSTRITKCVFMNKPYPKDGNTVQFEGDEVEQYADGTAIVHEHLDFDFTTGAVKKIKRTRSA